MDSTSPSKKRQMSSSFNEGTPNGVNRSKRILRDVGNAANLAPQTGNAASTPSKSIRDVPKKSENPTKNHPKPYGSSPSNKFHSSNDDDENGYVLTPRGLLTLCHDVSAVASPSDTAPTTPRTPTTVIRRGNPLIRGLRGDEYLDSPFNAICSNFNPPAEKLTSTPVRKSTGAPSTSSPPFTSSVDASLEDVADDSFERIVETAEESVCYENTFNGLSWISRLFDDDDRGEMETYEKRGGGGCGGVLPDTLDVAFNTVGRSAAAVARRPPPPLLGLDNQFVLEDSYRKRDRKKSDSGKSEWRRRRGRGWRALRKRVDGAGRVGDGKGDGEGEGRELNSRTKYESETSLSMPKSPSGKYLKKRWRRRSSKNEKRDAVKEWLDRCEDPDAPSASTYHSKLAPSSMLSDSMTSVSSFASSSSIHSCLSVSSWSIAESNEKIDEDDEDDDVDVSTAVEMSESFTYGGRDVSSISTPGHSVAQRPIHVAPHQTHVARFSFVPRHDDEVEASEGDALHREQESTDGWAQCVNLRTGARGVIPSAFLIPASSSAAGRSVVNTGAINGAAPLRKRPSSSSVSPRFRVAFLGSVEVAHHRGDDVLAKAIREVASIQARRRRRFGDDGGDDAIFDCWLEVHRNGVRIKQIVDEGSAVEIGKSTNGDGNRLTKLSRSVSKIFNFVAKGDSKVGAGGEARGGGGEANGAASTSGIKRGHDYFFPLKNVSFCGFHPAVDALFAFITKHPVEKRFAAHVVSTRALAEARSGCGGGSGSSCSSSNIAAALGNAFERCYQNIIKTMSDAVTEDIYLE